MHMNYTIRVIFFGLLLQLKFTENRDAEHIKRVHKLHVDINWLVDYSVGDESIRQAMALSSSVY